MKVHIKNRHVIVTDFDKYGREKQLVFDCWVMREKKDLYSVVKVDIHDKVSYYDDAGGPVFTGADSRGTFEVLLINKPSGVDLQVLPVPTGLGFYAEDTSYELPVLTPMVNIIAKVAQKIAQDFIDGLNADIDPLVSHMLARHEPIMFKWLDEEMGKNKQIPMPQTVGSAGYDLYFSNYKTSSGVTHHRVYIEPGQIVKCGTGIALWIKDPELVGNLYLRSSWCKKGLQLANSVGVIDSDYQGEIICEVRNDGLDGVKIEWGERFAQLVFHKVATPALVQVKEFATKTSRGTGGFGSTGTE